VDVDTQPDEDGVPLLHDHIEDDQEETPGEGRRLGRYRSMIIHRLPLQEAMKNGNGKSNYAYLLNISKD